MRPYLRSRPSTRPAQAWLVIGLSCLLVLTACSASTTVEMADTRAAAPAEAAESEPAAPDADGTAEPDTQSDAAQSEAADRAAADRAAAPETDGDRLFELEGELPLTDADVNSLITFIEEETGRPFLKRPVIVAQSTEDFVAGLTEGLDDFEAENELGIRNLQSLGLTTQGVGEVSAAFLDLLLSPEGVLGYYDPEPDKLYVPIDALAGDDFRTLLVHELTHALDGQYTDLSVLEALVEEAEISGDYEPIVALQAVVEGRASWVETQWRTQNRVEEAPLGDLGAAEAVPPAMLLSLSIPYVFGELFIDAEGGADDTWELLDDPPDSSEEFLVLGTVGERIVSVPVPAADGPVLEESVYGASDLLVWMLGESLDPNPRLIGPTLQAIDGWAGGRSVMWGDDTQTCTRIAFVADSPRDLNEIQELLNDWVARGVGRDLAADANGVTVTGCAPYVA